MTFDLASFALGTVFALVILIAIAVWLNPKRGKA